MLANKNNLTKVKQVNKLGNELCQEIYSSYLVASVVFWCHEDLANW